MSKRGLSREEKRTRLVEIFHESAEFYTLKELEKIAPKQKGIVQQSVKEILDELVSDGLVTFDKIGTSNYFWAFPSTAGATKQAALDKANAEAEAVEASIVSTQALIKAAAKGREDTPDRQKLLAKLTMIREESDKLKSELGAYGAADPVRYARKKDATEIAKAAAQRWTENTMILWSLAKNAAPDWDESGMRSTLGINETWEDI
ncbi:hypothetical protein CcaverHIS002_0103370 [Cutaneotrichosporon cavernicola]|uniref:Meiotic nuclear division protein 1 n=1 Tax=Cutaneotrichosporon cavernicola TaxID=279322 RepID=A0AA48ID98_9TREE|nr:uncharacterized protein CcaverHIS019_0103310 [Cutaneotrichosporon cavernicola]BEI79808.1 hypothetical protein CcaverHIS002_0103370 [Cutaneotrichosporon cavernicola]BEI87613.1 hypothetical protein CcaverHIS019_0103310 [Cutaneotrichosporon cavernicola]BEI95384.1 hypothetical protein CcaverHIS631_0103330 [Cutaneotrichosporon cavernicola]BEJ03158.1 hypothetical protein CcaverHIS641_0103330 [Cutaneotrichosporon cavernicola]